MLLQIILLIIMISDCYVAACGLPDLRKDHAVVIARFARDCLQKTMELTRRLERTLGPDTSDVSRKEMTLPNNTRIRWLDFFT